jgi:uncharacterized protein (DUF2336 family)
MIPISSDLISELETAFTQGTPEKRLTALWYTTDALLTGRFSDEQIWVFGEVLDRLATDLELKARARLAQKLGPFARAPTKVVTKLAKDDAIEVAGPVLANSERLDEQTLLDVARSKGQPHLMAITQRRTITEPVTEVLVTRGNQAVVRSVARNEGAMFSDSSFWRLVKRSENDSILAESVGSRKDIPRHQFLKLIAKASEEVRERLAALAPEAEDEVRHAVADLTGAIQARMGPASKEHYAAKRHVTDLYNAGGLGERELYQFARMQQFEQTAIAFSLLCGIPIDLAERALIEDHPEMILILGKAAGLSWKLVQELLYVRAGASGIAQQDLDAALEKYARLTREAARTVVKFYLERRKSAVC